MAGTHQTAFVRCGSTDPSSTRPPGGQNCERPPGGGSRRSRPEAGAADEWAVERPTGRRRGRDFAVDRTPGRDQTDTAVAAPAGYGSPGELLGEVPAQCG